MNIHFPVGESIHWVHYKELDWPCAYHLPDHENICMLIRDCKLKKQTLSSVFKASDVIIFFLIQRNFVGLPLTEKRFKVKSVRARRESIGSLFLSIMFSFLFLVIAAAENVFLSSLSLK